MDEVFKALGDPTRLKIVQMLAENGETCVCKIVEAFNLSQPAVSHHMGILKHAGLLFARREGQWIHYSLNVRALEEGPFAFLKEMLEAGLVSGLKTRNTKTVQACTARTIENQG